jgi:hypothetical protein
MLRSRAAQFAHAKIPLRIAARPIDCAAGGNNH